MSLDDFTFRLGDTGVVLNDDGDPFVDITKVVGLDSSKFRTTERDWEGNDGGFMDAEFEKGRSILLEGEVFADPDVLESYLDDLKENWAPSRTLIPFYFAPPGVNERLLFVKPLGCHYDWSTDRRLATAFVQFEAFAEDPRIYDSTEISLTVALNSTSSDGFSFNFGFDLGFGTVSTGLGTNAVNSGNRPTPPFFIINGPTVNPRIMNDDTGDEMRFEITLLADETLEVDTKYRTVRLDGVTNRRNALVHPSWFFLQKGDNHLRYLADVGTGTSMTVKYRSAWR